MDTAFQHFFEKRAGYPKFKSRDNYKSITYPQVDAVVKTFTKLPEGYIYLSGFGSIKINLHRDLDTATVKRINIKKKADGWYANITCEVAEATTVTSTNAVIGIDVGLSTFVATSEEEKIENPRHLRKREKYLKRMQRRLSRKQKGSQNRNKAKRKLAKQHLKISNQRKDFLHKVSCNLVLNNDVIIAEKLQIKNMVKNGKLAKSISDAGWSKLLELIKYKAQRYGKQFIQVPPNGTSQTCICGATVPKTLAVRVNTCPECGLIGNRDIVSAKVIKQRGMLALESAS